jgi:predicted amidohydrolase
MEILRTSLIQAELSWESKQDNLNTFAEKLAPLRGKTDLVVLPEMFTTGFSMNAAVLAEPSDGESLNWLRQQAKDLNAAVTGSYIVEEEGYYFNRLIFMFPDGSYQKYDKRHLFTLAKEHHTYQAGEERLIVEWKGWKICPLICYDLRFPVWSRNTDDYDLLIFVANWPETRAEHWTTLLKARAIENQCYAIGVNRVGEDANGLSYSGDTTLLDYYGKVLHQCSMVESVFTTSLSKVALAHYRSKLNFLPDRDSFRIIK